ncbi:DUF2254 domain-containing protein [Paraglaciecola sp.]|uniref:DUF2254 domain-containing protein n=1 Tax=Paraglaciecola sp. TaxID=1920173 RepID=UPI00273EB1D9|nr:DUF2254 domain-containing protein [Paraglaciecola sp.]MDP5033246.1 DUF2254 domain-containing protein [Paraglaciecola sp.]
MNNRILSLLETIRTSFWFIPALLVFSATLLASLVLSYDRYWQDYTPEFLQFIYHTSPESTRAILTTIASSMMTVTSIAFSITVVALSLASSQFGPRLIRNFMSDRGTQSVLGVFVAIFIYCLLVLQSTKSVEDLQFIPGMATYFAVLLAFVGVGVLIYFIHHVSYAIQADDVVDKVHCQLQKDIDRLFPNQTEWNKQSEPKALFMNNVNFSQAVKAGKDGYVQTVDFEKLVAIAKEHDIKINVLAKAGDAIVKSSTLLELSVETVKSLPDDAALRNCIMLGAKRTPLQDPEFAVRQLVEIAVRALSPGINDPYTAITCTDKLCAMLCDLSQRPFPPSLHTDDEGEIRVCTRSFEFSQIANASFNQIRQYGKDSIAVTIRLLESLILIAEHAATDNQKGFVQEQSDMIGQACEQSTFCNKDKADINYRLQQIREILEK